MSLVERSRLCSSAVIVDTKKVIYNYLLEVSISTKRREYYKEFKVEALLLVLGGNRRISEVAVDLYILITIIWS
jgi:hypothetical protein